MLTETQYAKFIGFQDGLICSHVQRGKFKLYAFFTEIKEVAYSP